jgi:hypothetical protein
MSDKYAIAGTVLPDGTQVTKALHIRDKKSGVYVVIGSIYFKWDNDKQKVVILDQEGWPKQQINRKTHGQNLLRCLKTGLLTPVGLRAPIELVSKTTVK